MISIKGERGYIFGGTKSERSTIFLSKCQLLLEVVQCLNWFEKRIDKFDLICGQMLTYLRK